MATKLVDHLARCNTTALIPLLGQATIALLERVGNDALIPKGLAYLVVRTHGEEAALRNSAIRELLFSNLSIEEGTALCELLQLPALAPSMTLNSADFDNNLSNAQLLMLWFDVSYETKDFAAQESEGSRKVAANNKFRFHQLTAYRKLRRAITDPTASALVHMPFGAGKLRLVATAVLDLYCSEPDGRVIVWLTPGEALCDEAFTELRLVWSQLGSHDVTVFRLYGNRPTPDLDGLGNCIVVADITNPWGDEPGLIELGRKTRVVVFGDAEHVGHPLGAAMIGKMSEGGQFSIVGISAASGTLIDTSPFRSVIGAKFANSCICIEDGDPVSQLRTAGNIGEIVIDLKPVPPSEARICETGLDISPEDISKISKDVDRNQALLELLLAESKAPGRIVFFTTTSEHARLFSGLLELRGVKAMAVTNEESPEQRALAIQKFNARDQKILCVHGFFVSGGAVPDLSVGVIAAPTLSEAVLHGMVGRLASDRGVASPRLRLVVFVDSIPGYERLVKSLGTWNELNI